MIRHAFVKVGMTNAFDDHGRPQGVTLLKAVPAKIVRQDTAESGKKIAIVEYDTGHRKKIQKGWVVEQLDGLPLGEALPFPALEKGQKIKITGHSKGRGFQDVMTRFGYGGGPSSHGSRFHRSPGSVGMRTEPGRVMKGKRMPGRDGGARITLNNIAVTYLSAEEGLIAVLGGVPGARGSVVFI